MILIVSMLLFPLPCASISAAGAKPNSLTDPTLATFLDVAVLRCLFVPQWMEEGVFWALNFILRR